MSIEPFGVTEAEIAIFVQVIPYPKETFKIVLKYQDYPHIEFDPATKLLNDAVDNIPEHGFAKNQEQRRNALYNKIEALEKMVEEGSLREAIDKLEFDIKDKLEKWLLDDYEVETALQLTKDQVTEVIDGMIERLNSVVSGQLEVMAPVKPTEFALYQNYPNSFNPDTWIPYQLADDMDVTIGIYDVSGHLIRSLNLGHKPAGFYTDKSKAAYWDGKNEAGEQVSSGIYFYTIQAGDFTATRKMVVAR